MDKLTPQIQLEPGALMPIRGHQGDVGWDIAIFEDVVISAANKNLSGALIRTGIRIVVPNGWYYRITARSSTFKLGLNVIEGIIDAGYTGELMIRVVPLPAMYNRLSYTPPQEYPIVIGGPGRPRYTPPVLKLEKGTRLAQIIFGRVYEPNWEITTSMPITERGEAGFGSTGQVGVMAPSELPTAARKEIFGEWSDDDD